MAKKIISKWWYYIGGGAGVPGLGTLPISSQELEERGLSGLMKSSVESGQYKEGTAPVEVAAPTSGGVTKEPNDQTNGGTE